MKKKRKEKNENKCFKYYIKILNKDKKDNTDNYFEFEI